MTFSGSRGFRMVRSCDRLEALEREEVQAGSEACHALENGFLLLRLVAEEAQEAFDRGHCGLFRAVYVGVRDTDTPAIVGMSSPDLRPRATRLYCDGFLNVGLRIYSSSFVGSVNVNLVKVLGCLGIKSTRRARFTGQKST